MVESTFKILESDKIGLNSSESYIVVRGRTSFLRILGGDPQWELMTATASEDHGRVHVCPNQLRLVEAALRLGAEVDTQPAVESDWMGREYVKICGIRRESGQDDESFNRSIRKLLLRFFVIYDDYRPPDVRSGDEMRELYKALAVDNHGADVYLSDGVWLSSNGTLRDRGR